MALTGGRNRAWMAARWLLSARRELTHVKMRFATCLKTRARSGMSVLLFDRQTSRNALHQRASETQQRRLK
jgi:hypothetical protein